MDVETRGVDVKFEDIRDACILGAGQRFNEGSTRLLISKITNEWSKKTLNYWMLEVLGS